MMPQTTVAKVSQPDSRVHVSAAVQLRCEAATEHVNLYLLLHGQHLFTCICVVSDVAEVLNLGSINLLILGRHQHAGDANKLQPSARCHLSRQVSVNVVDCQKQRF